MDDIDAATENGNPFFFPFACDKKNTDAIESVELGDTTPRGVQTPCQLFAPVANVASVTISHTPTPAILTPASAPTSTAPASFRQGKPRELDQRLTQETKVQKPTPPAQLRQEEDAALHALVERRINHLVLQLTAQSLARTTACRA